MTSWKTWAARAACLLMLAGAAQPFYLRMLTPQRAGYARMLTALPFTKTPGLRPFIEGVAARTKPGDTIAIVVPYTRWDGGYAYAYTRSTYLLAGRRTIPIVREDDRPMPENFAAAEYIACWKARVAIAGFTPVWTTPDGVLLRRVR